MKWLTPLGFLGLLGLIILIIIYIIKPNYQQKIISSTHIWRLSLKYRKKRLPINKLWNILLFLCQVLVITGIALSMAQPLIQGEQSYSENEKIVILDASADMLAKPAGSNETRFDRAIVQIHDLADEMALSGGVISVIVADYKPYFAVQRAEAGAIDATHESLAVLQDVTDYKCSYGSADMDAAMLLAEDVLAKNHGAQVVLYTGTTYTVPGDVTVVNVGDENEWNAGILQAEAVSVENYYEFRIDLASYGKDSSIKVNLDIFGVNEAKTTLNLNHTVTCTQQSGTVTLTFGNDKEKAQTQPNYILTEIYSYDYAFLQIEANDSLLQDNTLYLYGGSKPELKIQYYSSLPNQFYTGVLMTLRSILDNTWDIQLTEVKDENEPALSGFDVYIFEHTMPAQIPTDGLVILADPDTVPTSGGFTLGGTFEDAKEMFLTPGAGSELMENLDPTAISLTQYSVISNFDGKYEALMYCGNSPVLLAANEPGHQVVVMPFSMHRSNLPVLKEFPILMYNLLMYYTPSTVTEYLYEVNDIVKLNARADTLEIEGFSVDTTVAEFPYELRVTGPGVYTLMQSPVEDSLIVESFCVKLPAQESNIWSVEDTLTNPRIYTDGNGQGVDGVYYLAMALIALLFVEWWLQSKEYF